MSDESIDNLLRRAQDQLAGCSIDVTESPFDFDTTQDGVCVTMSMNGKIAKLWIEDDTTAWVDIAWVGHRFLREMYLDAHPQDTISLLEAWFLGSAKVDRRKGRAQTWRLTLEYGQVTFFLDSI